MKKETRKKAGFEWLKCNTTQATIRRALVPFDVSKTRCVCMCVHVTLLVAQVQRYNRATHKHTRTSIHGPPFPFRGLAQRP